MLQALTSQHAELSMAQWLHAPCPARTMSSVPATKLSITTSLPSSGEEQKNDGGPTCLPAAFHLSPTFLSYHHHFYGLSFHSSVSTVRLESALMSGRGFGVFAGQYVASVGVLLPHSCCSAAISAYDPFYASSHHPSTGTHST